MADTKNTPEETTNAPERSRQRRLELQGWMAAAIAAAGAATVLLPWYQAAIPVTVLRDRQMQTVGEFTVNTTITGWGLTHQTTVESFDRLGSAMLQLPEPSSIAGLPQSTFFLILAGIAVALGAMVRFSLISFLAIPLAAGGMSQLTTLRETVENPTFGGAYNTATTGVHLTELALAFIILAAIAVTIQVFMVNAKLRRVARERAKAAGEPVKHTLWEILGAIQTQGLSRLLAMPASAQKDTDADDKAATSA